MAAPKDRLEYILHIIETWRHRDPELEDKEGFLENLRTYEIGILGVGNAEIWIQYYKDAKRKGFTVAELLFEKAKEGLKTMAKRESDKPVKRVEIDVVLGEKLLELKEMAERRRTHAKQRIRKE
jgi:hypothetical protein